MDAEAAPISFLGRPLAPGFAGRVVVLLPGNSLLYAANDWRGALVVVEQGRVALDALDGRRLIFERGAILALDGLLLRSLSNPGDAPALLVAITRL